MASRADPYGYDLYVGPQPDGSIDMSRNGRSCSGAELVRNAMLARCLSDTLPMVGAPGGYVAFGKNVRTWVGSAIDDTTADSRARELAVVFARDPRLDPGSITVAIATQPRGAQHAFTITASARLTDSTPIDLVLGVSSISVDVLAQQGASS